MRHQAFHPRFPSARWDRVASPGLDLALFAWLMFAVAFLFPLTAPAGAVMAYVGRARGAAAGAVARSHFDAQIRLFWRSLLVLLLVGVLHALVAGIGAITFGIGLAFMVVPWGLGLAWLAWAIWSIGSGALQCWRRQPA